MIQFVKRDLSNKRKYPSLETEIIIVDNIYDYDLENYISYDHKWYFLENILKNENPQNIKLYSKYVYDIINEEDLNFQEISFEYLTKKYIMKYKEGTNIPLSNNMDTYKYFLEEEDLSLLNVLESYEE